MKGTAAARLPHEAYPVRTVARLTGLSPDIIRAWERRYGVVSPRRGPRGSRLYTSRDVEHLRVLARVVGAGRAIGDVGHLKREQLERLAGDVATRRPAPDFTAHPAPAVVERVLDLVNGFDAAGVERELGDALVGLGARAFACDVVAPLLTEVGERWSTGLLSVAQEHIVSAAVRRLLAGVICSRPRNEAPVVLLATPSGERHECGILVCALLLLDAGLGVAYVGADLPAIDIAAAAERPTVAAVALGLTDASCRDTSVSQVRAVARSLPERTEIWLGGRDAAAAGRELRGERVLVIDSLESLKREALRLRAASTVPQ